MFSLPSFLIGFLPMLVLAILVTIFYARNLATVRRLSAENAELREPQLLHLQMDARADRMDVAVRHPVFGVIAQMLWEMFTDYDAKNYIEVPLEPIPISRVAELAMAAQGQGTFYITLQKTYGKTPHQKRLEAEAEAERLRKTLRTIAGHVVYFNLVAGDDGICSMPVACECCEDMVAIARKAVGE